MSDFVKVIDKYVRLRADRQPIAEKFLDGKRPYMIFQTPNGDIWGDNRTSEQCFNANIKYIESSLNVASDHLLYLNHGSVLVYLLICSEVNMYVWREGEAPAVHYMYHTLDEIVDVIKPNWQNGEIANLVLDTIRYFKSKTGDAIPIVWTDTQSACDNATLLLDASETFIGCMIDPELIMKFMEDINRLIIEFSQVQAEVIGEALLKPGHIMLSQDGFSGLSISDDNLAVGSPDINKRFNLPLDEEIGKAMGGVAIHSCGRWSHTMSALKELTPSCTSIDCAIDGSWDPNPNKPEEVRDAMAGSGIYVHVRVSGESNKMMDQVKRVIHPELKLIIHPNYIDAPTAERNYHELEKLLSSYYKAKI